MLPFGLKAILHSPLTIVETTIPIMLIAIGCADGVHIISEFFGFVRKGHATPHALQHTMRLLTLPVILTSVTTSLGFLSLLTAPGVSIRNTGVFLAFGIAAFVVKKFLDANYVWPAAASALVIAFANTVYVKADAVEKIASSLAAVFFPSATCSILLRPSIAMSHTRSSLRPSRLV